MKAGFYPKLAFDGIRKNKRMYLPYILTCIGMVMMHYIIAFLYFNDALSYLPGSATMRPMLWFGSWVIAVFAGIFLFYTNSFLLRCRKKEFGLYNILGMGKRNIALVLFWETVIVSAVSLAAGLIAGIAFSKLAELGFINILQGDINYTFSVPLYAVLLTAKIFGVILLLLFFNALRQIRFSSAIALIRSENMGEKVPKGNWFLGILGAVILGAAYFIAVSIKNPVAAFAIFFIAVLMVIIGTYMLMISGSVLFCRILQRKKNYYYKPNHFISVSSMVYRMKRNGAGLASVCILATMVLVMVSSTTALFFGIEDSLQSRYPREINAEFRFSSAQDLSNENLAAVKKNILTVAERHGVTPNNLYDYKIAPISGLLSSNTVETDVRKINNITDYSDVFQFFIIPLDDYNAITQSNESLGENEALIYTYRTDYTESTISFNGGNTFNIKKHADKFIANSDAAMNIIPTIALIVPDFNNALSGLERLADYNGDQMLTIEWVYAFDTGLEKSQQLALFKDLKSTFDNFETDNSEQKYRSFYFESREANREEFYGLYGGFFYLGIILSIVFMFATVLIIYYKQISEGYEDQARFNIMQKVGMTKKDIRKSINSQLLTVFFLPLACAGCHLAFAFPMIRKLLLLFNLNNLTLFAVTTLISFVVFAVFYTVVYRLTSNAYYNIVSGEKKTEL